MIAAGRPCGWPRYVSGANQPGNWSAGGVGLGDHPEPPGNGVVVAVGARSKTLVQELHLAGADGEALVVAGPDHVAAAEVLGPRGAAEGDVAAADEGVAFGVGQRAPGAGQRTGGVGGEVPVAVGADRFGDQQVLVLPGDLVDVVGLEEVVLIGVLRGDDRVTHAVGEAREGCLRPVQVPVVIDLCGHPHRSIYADTATMPSRPM